MQRGGRGNLQYKDGDSRRNFSHPFESEQLRERGARSICRPRTQQETGVWVFPPFQGKQGKWKTVVLFLVFRFFFFFSLLSCFLWKLRIEEFGFLGFCFVLQGMVLCRRTGTSRAFVFLELLRGEDLDGANSGETFSAI